MKRGEVSEVISQKIKVTQSQIQKLSLSQTMKQSLMILQLDMPDLIDYLREKSLENPLFDLYTGFEHSVGNIENLCNSDTSHNSLLEYLLEQVFLTMRDTPIRKVVLGLLAYLDTTGYFSISDEEMRVALNVDATTYLDAKTLLQQLDPPGVGANSLQECLLLQAQRSHRSMAKLSQLILQKHFEDLVAGRLNLIANQLHTPIAAIYQAYHLIQTFIAIPGEMYSSTQTNYILPELKIIRIGDLISLKQTKFGQPQLIFANQTYKQLCQSQDSEVVHYVKTKKAQYENLKTALNRRSSTVRLIAESIIRTQYKYILKKTDILRPLLLRQVATQLHVSESTVSRAIHGVYIETERGVVPLKGFFTRYATRNRTSGQSVSEIEQAIQTIIAEENQTQPLSDEKIKQRLNQQGFPISRRAVTKHRSNLGILSTRERKE